MGKGKKHKKKVQVQTANSHEKNGHSVWSKQELVGAIVEAYDIIEKRKKEAEELEKEKQKRAWQQKIGQKDYSKEPHWIKRKVYTLANDIWIFFKIFTISKKDIPEGKFTISFISVVFSGFLKGIGLLFYILAAICVYVLWKSNWPEGTIHIAVMIICILYGRFFRLTGYEIENIEDSDFLLNIFASFIAVIALVISIIAIYVD